jgi:hypothetical protein
MKSFGSIYTVSLCTSQSGLLVVERPVPTEYHAEYAGR